MSDPLDAELDALFQQLPAAFVEARNALADRLRKRGNRGDAERIKKLKRPSLSAWALNQLHFQQPALLAAAQDAASALKALHARDGIGPSDLSAAVTTQRRAVQAAIDAAVRSGAQAGIAINSVDQRRLDTTLQAWLAGAGDEAPGRMTHELEASGFAAVTAVGEASPRKPPAANTNDTPVQAVLPLAAAASPASAPDPERIARARLELRSREQAADAARRRVGQLRDELNAEASEVERTRRQVHEAEQTLRALKTRLEQQQATLPEKHANTSAAESALHEAEQGLAEARAELARV